LAKEGPVVLESDRLKAAIAYDNDAKTKATARQVVRKKDRDAKAIKSSKGIPNVLEEDDWEKDVHKILICDAKEEIASCGKAFLTSGASPDKKDKYRSIYETEKLHDVDEETAHARAVLSLIMLFSSILRYEYISDSPLNQS
jgi:hypothetical protein